MILSTFLTGALAFVVAVVMKTIAEDIEPPFWYKSTVVLLLLGGCLTMVLSTLAGIWV